tara:strand:- start:622 stop:741 length:120 start_codon:yes stop_codon:yes gene_type:complete
MLFLSAGNSKDSHILLGRKSFPITALTSPETFSAYSLET